MTAPRQTHMNAVAEAEAALAAPLQLGPNAEITNKPLAGKTVFSVRLPMEIAGEMLTEAERLGVKPSTLAGELVAEALAARRSETDTYVVSVGDLRRAIREAARHRAA